MANRPISPTQAWRPSQACVHSHEVDITMADYPCDIHRARYPGESTRAYLNLYRGDEVAAFRASLCGECLCELMTAWLEHALAKDPEGRWAYPEPPHVLEATWNPRSGPPANGATWTRV